MIETIHKVIIYYEADWRDIEKIEEKLLKLKTPIQSACFSGNAAAGPYYKAECKTNKQAIKVHSQALRIIHHYCGKEV